jgi:hypothetical protein
VENDHTPDFEKVMNSWNEFSKKIQLFHFSKANKPKFILDPQMFLKLRNAHSRNDWNISNLPRVFFYTNLDHKESFFENSQYNLYSVDVEPDEIYDLTKDESKLVLQSIGKYSSSPDLDKVLKTLANHTGPQAIKNALDRSYKGVYYLTTGGMEVVAWFEEIEVELVY